MPYPLPLDTNQGSEIEEVLGVKCTFESDCAWTWQKHLSDGFYVVTGANLTESNMTGMMPGPAADSFNDANGIGILYKIYHFFVLILIFNIF